MQPVMQQFDITLISAGKSRLIRQLFAKYRSADLNCYIIEKFVMLIAIILRNNRKLKSWSLHIEQLDCCPV